MSKREKGFAWFPVLIIIGLLIIGGMVVGFTYFGWYAR